MPDQRNPRSSSIAVLSGGDSAEREVSLRSGAAVSQALAAAGHRILNIDPADVDLASVPWNEVAVAFLALHGSGGEDGRIQAFLESRGVVYTGSGPAASRLAFSKLESKSQFARAAVPTAPWMVIDVDESADQRLEKAHRLGWPLVVKPDQQGSSIGVSIVASAAGFASAVQKAFVYGPVALLEQAICGAEWTVGLLDGTPLPPIRIGTGRPFFDYDAKYFDDATQYIFEAPTPHSTAASVSRVAAQACAAIGTCGVARVDVMVDSGGRPYVLEVNTIPGFTDHSLVPKAAARAGVSFVELCEWCLASARRNCASRRAA